MALGEQFGDFTWAEASEVTATRRIPEKTQKRIYVPNKLEKLEHCGWEGDYFYQKNIKRWPHLDRGRRGNRHEKKRYLEKRTKYQIIARKINE